MIWSKNHLTLLSLYGRHFMSCLLLNSLRARSQLLARRPQDSSRWAKFFHYFLPEFRYLEEKKIGGCVHVFGFWLSF